MQTKHEIQRLLASVGALPNKQHGQNFLIDLNLMKIILRSANLNKDDIVLEVGCGTGSLTEELVKGAGFVVVAEIDEVMAKLTKLIMKDSENLLIVNEDALKTKHRMNEKVVEAIKQKKNEFGGKFKLVANLPYSAGTPVIINLVTGELAADEMHVTVQKEVAQRMAAKVGDSNYGSLSIFLAAAGTVELVKILPPSVFWPPPQVESAIVSFKREEEKAERIKDMGIFEQTVNLFIQHRRKMLKASTKLAAGKMGQIPDWEKIFTKAKVDPRLRPGDISPEQFVEISNACTEAIK